jgi:hypothetical protein
LYGGGLKVANFAINTSGTAGTVFLGEGPVVVGPHEKLELATVPSYWTRNIQLVKGLTSRRKVATESPAGDGSGGSDGGEE